MTKRIVIVDGAIFGLEYMPAGGKHLIKTKVAGNDRSSNLFLLATEAQGLAYGQKARVVLEVEEP